MTDPQISVVMSCFNHGPYIAEAINSILSQSFSDFEFIIVDDGSTDNTPTEIKKFQDPRIKIVSQSNNGPSIAYNRGIKLARGKFIALMSDDDISETTRLEIQLHQIEKNDADIIFSLPQIINKKSELIDTSYCHWFFNKSFNSNHELFRKLFFEGNFLCAPSAFFRTSVFSEIGYFMRGLIQLQDYEFWFRASKMEKKILLFSDPLILYRYTKGTNLSSEINDNRIAIETMQIYENVLLNMPASFFKKAFPDFSDSDIETSTNRYFTEQSNLLFSHPNPIVKTVGGIKKIQSFEFIDDNPENIITASEENVSLFFAEENKINMPILKKSTSSKKIKQLANKVIRPEVEIHLSNEQIQKMVDEKIKSGDFTGAIALLKGNELIHPESSSSATILRYGRKIQRLFDGLISKTKEYILRKKELVGEITHYTVSRLLDYSKLYGEMIYEGAPEKIFIQAPKIVNPDNRELFEGWTNGPVPYISHIRNVKVLGGTNLIFSDNGLLLNDELVDYPDEDFGIKALQVVYRYNDMVFVKYSQTNEKRIANGIFISCGHDNNYYHWIIECLPKISFIDQHSIDPSIPLLVPNDLHPNLKYLLSTLVNNRKIIYLQNNLLYFIDDLYIASPLSRILDRYDGDVKYDQDIVLSPSWISKIAESLNPTNRVVQRPWRKIFITRRNGLRAVSELSSIEEMVLAAGYEVVDLDSTSIEFQRLLFSQTAVIISPTGAALTNMVFCQPGTKVLVFMSNHQLTNYYMWSQLGSIFNIELKFLLGQRLYHLTNRYSVHDDYSVDLPVLNEMIKILG
jgi:glycosyltransferase involved in cell wall biosynthesis